MLRLFFTLNTIPPRIRWLWVFWTFYCFWRFVWLRRWYIFIRFCRSRFHGLHFLRTTSRRYRFPCLEIHFCIIICTDVTRFFGLGFFHGWWRPFIWYRSNEKFILIFGLVQIFDRWWIFVRWPFIMKWRFFFFVRFSLFQLFDSVLNRDPQTPRSGGLMMKD